MDGGGGAKFCLLFSLEKYRCKIILNHNPNPIHNLNINGVITDDDKFISDFCSKFYSNV